MFLKKASSWINGLGVRAQLILLFVTLFGVFFAVFSTAVSLHMSRTHEREFDSALYNYVIEVSHSVDLSDAHGHDPILPSNSEMILPFSLGETFLQISTPDKEVLLRSKSLGKHELPAPSTEEMERLLKSRAVFEDVYLPEINVGRFRMVTHMIRREDAGMIVVQAAVPMIMLERQQEALVTFFIVAVPLMLLLAALFGLAFSGRAMAPIAAMIARANEIEAKHLSERIPVPNTRDEIRDLAVTLNGLLGRLEKAFRTQEGFVADASHQLKTPLTILKGELEIFRKGTRTPEELEEFVQSASQEIDYLSKIVEDLLLLARMDAEGGRPAIQSIQFDEKVLTSVARFERLAKPKGVRFSVHLDEPGQGGVSSFALKGEPELLRSLVDNLLDNAVKYSPKGGVVQVSLFDRGSELALCVEDSGDGIPEALLSKLFGRFYRTESTRDKVSGSGLGLSIVKRIAQLHQGRVNASNRSTGGASFEVILPRVPHID